jgi:hypothetical protein
VIDLTCESDSDDGEVRWHRKASRRYHIKLTSPPIGYFEFAYPVLRSLPHLLIARAYSYLT